MKPGKLILRLIVGLAISSVLALVSGCSSNGGAAAGKAPSPSMAEQAALEDQGKLQAVIRSWLEAQGGAFRLAKVKNVLCIVGVTEGANRSFFRTAETFDGRYRYDMLVANGSLSGGYDGADGWQDNGSWGVGIFKKRRGDPAWSLWSLRALHLTEIFPRQKLLPDETVAGQACAVLDLGDAAGRRERWYVSRNGGSLVRAIRDFGHGPLQTVYDYRDYRTVSGITIPFGFTATRADGGVTKYELTRVEVNDSLDGISFSPSGEARAKSLQIEGVLRRGLVAGGWSPSSDHPSLRARAKILSPTTGVETQLTVCRRQNDHVLVEKTTAGMGVTVSAFDGMAGWENSEMLGFHKLEDNEINELVTTSWLGCDPYLRERFPLRSWIGAATVEGKTAVAVGLHNFGGIGGKFYFDADSGQLLRVEMEENASMHVRAVKVDFSDYRPVGSFFFPFRVSYTSYGVETTIQCESIELDVPMPDSMFAPQTEDR